MAAATGTEPAKALGRRLADVLPELETRGVLPVIQHVLTRGTVEVLAPALHRYLFACPPAEPSSAFDRMQQHVTIGPLRDDGRISGIVVTVEDVTARMTRERQLAEELTQALSASDWRTRRTAVEALAPRGSEIIPSLVQTLREQHQNLNVLSSAVDLLAISDIDVVEPLTALLDDDNADLRIHAALMLGERRDIRAAPALIAHLTDPDMNVQFHVIEALGRLRATDAAEALIAIAERRDFFLSFPAIQALSRLGNPAAGPRLVPLLADPMLRAPVIEALGELGDQDVTVPLVRLLNAAEAPPDVIADALAGLGDRYEHRYDAGDHIGALVRRSISASGTQMLIDAVQRVSADRLAGLAKVLGWLDGEAAQRALTRLLGHQTVRAQVVEALVRHGGGVVALLIEQLQAEDLDTRQAAAVALGRIGDRRATPALIDALEDPEVAVAAAGALARIGDSDAFEALIRRIGDRDSGFRQAVVAALNSIGHPEMPRHIAECLQHADAIVRETALKIAGYFGYPECEALVIARCADDIENVRRTAVEQLPFFDNPRVFATLAGVLAADTPTVRAAAAAALSRVEHDGRLEALRRAAGDDDPWVRYFALRSIGTIGDTGSLPLVVARLQDPAPHVRLSAIDVIGRLKPPEAAHILEPLTDSPNDDIAGAAIAALGWLDDADVLHVLERLARSPDVRRSLAAVNALGARRDARVPEMLQWVAAADARADVAGAAIDALAAVATRDDEQAAAAARALVALTSEPRRREAVVTALSALPVRRVPDIARGLRHPAPGVRRACVEVLGRMRHPDASHALDAALDDSAPEVRHAAVVELKHLGARTSQRKLLMLARTDPDAVVRDAALRAIARTEDAAGAAPADAR